MKKLFAVLFICLIFSTGFAQVINLYPTNWWVGMKWNKVQVLVHADYSITNSKVTLHHPGVTLDRKSTRLNSSHRL